LDAQRRIVLANIDPDFRVRLEPEDALAALRRVTSVTPQAETLASRVRA